MEYVGFGMGFFGDAEEAPVEGFTTVAMVGEGAGFEEAPIVEARVGVDKGPSGDFAAVSAEAFTVGAKVGEASFAARDVFVEGSSGGVVAASA